MTRKSVVRLAVALILLSAIGVLAHAQSSAAAIGEPEYKLVQSLFLSPLGMVIGMVVTLMGVWQFFVRSESAAGAILIVLGVVLTLMPQVYAGVRAITCPIANALGAQCGGAGG